MTTDWHNQPGCHPWPEPNCDTCQARLTDGPATPETIKAMRQRIREERPA